MTPMKQHPVLIVDDDRNICRLVTRILAEERYRCHVAHTVAGALRTLESTTIHLLLCDIGLEGESGLDLVGKVGDNFEDIAIIMLTGIDDPHVARVAIEKGAWGYVIKPFTRNELRIQIANAIHRRQLEIDHRASQKCLELEFEKRSKLLTKLKIQLEENQLQLGQREDELADVSAAIDLLLKRHDQIKKDLEENILVNIHRVALPYFEMIEKRGLDLQQRAYLEIVRSTLADILSPLEKNLASHVIDLTPGEAMVAHLIKQGKRSKEIAEILNLSMNTIMTHRYKIRKKLGLLHKRQSLQARLREIQHQ